MTAVSPPGYPAECEHLAQMRDGTAYRIRPIRPEDLEREYEFVRALSEESRYNRLMYAVHEPTDELLKPLVNIDYVRHMALVGLLPLPTGDRIVGVARYAEGTVSGQFEFAIVVADEWQGQGIGTTLLRDLFDYARAHGLRRLVGTVLPGNDRMLALARGLGLTAAMSVTDPSLIVVSMTLEPPARPGETAIQRA